MVIFDTQSEKKAEYIIFINLNFCLVLPPVTICQGKKSSSAFLRSSFSIRV